MSDLLGAWSLTGQPLDELVSAADRRAMLAQLPSHPGRLRELRRGRLWLCAAEGRLADDGVRALGFEGLVAWGQDGGPGRLLAEVPTDGDWDRPPDGHYVLALVDGRDRLTLLRSLSGGERLYVTRVGDVVLFACSVRPLLAHGAVSAELDPGVVDDVLLSGHTLVGSATVLRGVEEVLPGHVATFEGGELRQRWQWRDALRSPEGPVDALARRFRGELARSIELAVGRRRPIAIALSGGIDSSAVVAAALEVVPADDIQCFTYEFDDPTHASEEHFARSVTARLGIRRHEVFRLGYEDFIDAIPEHVWRSESAVHWPKAFLLPVARHIHDRGFDRYLTGFGIGSHMAYVHELAAALRWRPLTRWLPRHWKLARSDGWTMSHGLARLHPGLEPPHPRLVHLLLRLLEQEGYVRDRTAFYPPEMQAFLCRDRLFDPLDPGERELPLRDRLQLRCFARLLSCIDVTRSEKASREVGACRVSPAHSSWCIPYAYFPVRPPPFVWGATRRQRPGKVLLQRAFRGILPDEVLFREKSWDDAVVSRKWRRQGRVMMLRALGRFPDDMATLGPGYPDAVRFWEPRSIQASCLSFWLWHEMFVRRPVQPRPFTWPQLLEPTPSRPADGHVEGTPAV